LGEETLVAVPGWGADEAGTDVDMEVRVEVEVKWGAPLEALERGAIGAGGEPLVALRTSTASIEKETAIRNAVSPRTAASSSQARAGVM
jgi:hypothetical protein